MKRFEPEVTLSNRNDGPIAGYEKLTGRKPTAEQLRRLDRIRVALQLREDDALWSVILALEDYFRLFSDVPARYAEAGRAQAEALRADIMARSDLRHVLGEPIMKRLMVVSTIVAFVISVIGVIVIAERESERNKAVAELAQEYTALAYKNIHDEVSAIVEKEVSAEIQPLANIQNLLANPETRSLIDDVLALSDEERARLLHDEPQLISILRDLAFLTPPDKAFLLNAAIDPHSATTIPVSQWIIEQIKSRNSTLVRVIAAYAARNPNLNRLISELPAACTLKHLEFCR